MDKEIKPTKPAAEDANLLAFATILSGLLASGHYTDRAGDSGMEEPDLTRFDYGEKWREAIEPEWFVSCRFHPTAIDSALELFKTAKAVAKNPELLEQSG